MAVSQKQRVRDKGRLSDICRIIGCAGVELYQRRWCVVSLVSFNYVSWLRNIRPRNTNVFQSANII
jgi:hypothetical protein